MKEIKVTVGYSSEELAMVVDDLRALIARDDRYITELEKQNLISSACVSLMQINLDRAMEVVKSVLASVAHAEDRGKDDGYDWHPFNPEDESTYPPEYRDYLVTVKIQGKEEVDTDEWQDYSCTYRAGDGWECYDDFDVLAWAEKPEAYHAPEGGAE